MKMLLQNLAACLLLLLLKKTHYLIMPCEGIQPMKGSSAGKEYRFVQKNLSLLSCTLSRVIFAHFVRSFEKRIADSYIFPTKAALSWSASESIEYFMRQTIFASVSSWFEDSIKPVCSIQVKGFYCFAPAKKTTQPINRWLFSVETSSPISNTSSHCS